ncbi:hypothetical protein GF407_11900 [candidate division KSB1 bacterium]|nr:hypothetical protein [candidate division KSB1 bacterium]
MNHKKPDIDFSWFQNHLDEIIINRFDPVITSHGLFMPCFDRKWNHIQNKYSTLLSQARLLYVFSTAYRLYGDETYLCAVERGIEFLFSKFRDNRYGGLFHGVDPDGNILDDRKSGYAHTFVIFGLVHAWAITGDPRHKERALEMVQFIRSHFMDKAGGLYFFMSRDFKPETDFKSQNPTMHYFEALLKTYEETRQKNIFSEVERVADFVLKKLVRQPDVILPEIYDNHWQEHPEGRIDLGHQLEWAFLLSRAVGLGFPGRYLDYGYAFIRNAIAIGYDPVHGGLNSPATPQKTLFKERKNWWEQCELVRCLLHYTVKRGLKGYEAPLEKSIDFIKNEMIDPVYGGWFTTLEAGNDLHKQYKSCSGKEHYHIIGMCLEALSCRDVLNS